MVATKFILLLLCLESRFFSPQDTAKIAHKTKNAIAGPVLEGLAGGVVWGICG
jgi:hypothetical protein